MTDPALGALLALQHKDTEIDQAQYRWDHLAERLAVDEVMGRAGAIKARLDEAMGPQKQCHAAQSSLAGQVAALVVRIDEISARLYGDQMPSPKDAEAMTHEIEQLKARQSALEDEELGVMEEMEQHNAAIEALETEAAPLAAAMKEAQSKLRQVEDEIGAELARLRAQRQELAAAVNTDLLTRYDALRPRMGGVAVATLDGRKCGGCHLELAPGEVSRVRQGTASSPAICEECGRILIALD